MNTIQIETKALQDALKTIKKSKIVESKTTMPILSNVLVKSLYGFTKLTGSNIDHTIVCDVVSASAGNFDCLDITLNFEQLSKLVSQIKDPFVVLRQEGTKVKINNFEMVGVSSEEYPNVVTYQNCTIPSLQVTPSLLRRLKTIAHSASTDKSRYNLNGVYFNGKASEIVATDGHRMTIYTHNLNSKTLDKIVPLSFIGAVLAINKDGKFDFEDSQVVFKSNNLTMYSRYIDGNFPDYAMVLNTRCLPLYINNVNVKNLLSLTKSALTTIGKTDKCFITKFSFYTDNTLSLEVNTPNGSYKDSMNGLSGSIEIALGLNSKYVSEYLTSLTNDDEKIDMQLSGTTGPVVFTTDSMAHVVMPVRLS